MFNQPQNFSSYFEESKCLTITPSLSFSPSEHHFNSDSAPSSPLLSYSARMPAPVIGNLLGNDKIWKAPGQGNCEGVWGDGMSQVTSNNLWNVDHQKLSARLHAQGAVWWNGAVQIDADAHEHPHSTGQLGSIRTGE
jgi:hypothetical protein